MSSPTLPPRLRFTARGICAAVLATTLSCRAGSDQKGEAMKDSTAPRTVALPADASPATASRVSAGPNDTSRRVGLHLPEEFTDIGAPVTQYMASSTYRDSTAAMALVHVAIGQEREEVWLAEHLPRARADDPTGWTVLDALSPPDALSNELRIWLGCSRRGTPDPRLIAVVHYEDLTTLTRIEHAWSVDRAHRIVTVPTDGITCHNEIVVD